MSIVCSNSQSCSQSLQSCVRHHVMREYVIKAPYCKMLSSLWPGNAIWPGDAIFINIVSADGLLPDGTKPLTAPMLTCHQWSPVAFTWGQFHSKCTGNIIANAQTSVTGAKSKDVFLTMFTMNYTLLFHGCMHDQKLDLTNQTAIENASVEYAHNFKSFLGNFAMFGSSCPNKELYLFFGTVFNCADIWWQSSVTIIVCISGDSWKLVRPTTSLDISLSVHSPLDTEIIHKW